MAVAQLTLSEALTRPPLGRISTQSQGPPPRIDLDIDRSSPFDDDRSPCSSGAASAVASFHTAHDRVSEIALATLVSSLERDSSFRRRPTSLTIPTVGFGEPLFSSYPFQMSGGPNAADTTTTEASSSSAWTDHGRPSPPAADSGNIKDSSDIARASSLDRTRTPSTASLSRSRSASAVGLVKAAQDLSSNYGHLQPRSRARHNRRASLSSGEFDVGHWRETSVPAFQHSVPYSFGQRQDDDYTLESVKMASGLRPLSPVPSLTSRRHSSIITTDSDLFKLADLSISKNVEPDSEQLVDDDHFFYDKDDQRIAADGASFVSQPSTLSPSTMTKSLPSTKTSLSRSARSGKEGEPIDVQLAKKLSETANALINRRRMVLLEIVETEVTYVHDLRALVKIYLPQLATLPHVSERVHHLITRNTTELLDFHVQFAAHMVDILKHCDMGYEDTDAGTIDHATKRIADLFVREATCFALYDDYCAGSTTAAAVIRNIAHRADYESFEQQCQAASSGMPHTTLLDILTDQTPQPCRTRLRFKDILITPVQRICRYPLLLASLLADVQGELPPPDVVAAIESAQSAMRAVAESADDARQRQEAELKTAAVADRLEPIPALSFDLRSLGVCRLIGALDVLYHHPTDAPLENPVKVRHLAAFLYNGYLILAKCRRNRMFEPKHYLPLEMFEFVDITEGFLPHSIRLGLNDHNFDLAASCDAEKDLWACELCAARDESTIPPFELPFSFRMTSHTTRHSSVITSNDEDTETPEEAKRHTILGNELVQSPLEGSEADLWDAKATPRRTPAASPVTRSPEYRRSQSSTLLLRRASTTQRLHVDRCLADVMSESLATARSKAQLQTHPTPAYDSRRISLLDSPMLRRRRSIADVRPSMDIVNPTEVRGAVMPSRPNSRRLARARSCIIADRGVVDGPSTMSTLSRDTSMSSLVDSPDIPPALRSLRPSLSLRRLDIAMTPKHSERPSRRKTISRSPAGLTVPTLSRAQSMPTSPQLLGPSHRSANSSRAEIKSHSRHHSSSGSATTRVHGHSRHNSRSSLAEASEHRRQPSLSGSTTDDDYVMIKTIAEYPKAPRRHASSVGAAQPSRTLSPVRNADAEAEESATGATPGSSTTPVSGISRSPSLLRSPGLLLRSPSRMIRTRARTSEFPPSALRRSPSYPEADASLSSSHSRASDTSLPSTHSSHSGGSFGRHASDTRPPSASLRMRSLSGVSLSRAFSYRSGASNTKHSTPPIEVVAADTDTSGTSGTPTPPNGPATGPRRRRSMRFFGNLRAFTPYHER